MDRHVKGVLFADYVRMIRSQKGVDWSGELSAEDLRWVASKIAPDDWYPMAVFERLGNGILRQIARGDLEMVRMFGRFSVDALRARQPMLLAPGDPVETLNRFRILRSSFFDFEALEVTMLLEDQALIAIRYHMGHPAEEAAACQTMGFFERLLEIAGATTVFARFAERSWAGDARTLLELSWRAP